ncbi:sulfotransferase family 2 domain-containing protein [Anderseniella sp. Alg231-50]|uniref:sulfotransferase family 2 domain-containing protein n=1 Tax=Anderseniella sp. Alg231-50 TaxID=1922226 RepID=UPI000D55AEBE
MVDPRAWPSSDFRKLSFAKKKAAFARGLQFCTEPAIQNRERWRYPKSEMGKPEMTAESTGIRADADQTTPLLDGRHAPPLSFDNRSEPLKHFDNYRNKKNFPVRRRIRHFLRSQAFPYYVGGLQHYAFTHNARHYLFCWIPKNASTTMFDFMWKKIPPDFRRDAKKMPRLFRFFGARRRTHVDRSQCSFFIYRNPVDRLVSLFNNKFVQSSTLTGDDRESLILSFEYFTLTSPLDTTFSDFVRVYLQRYLRLFSGNWLLDVHVIPQADCLWPIHYTHVLRFECLHEDISLVLGKDTADQFFTRKINSSSTARYDDPSAKTAVSELRRRFAETGELPSLRAYVDDELEAIIRNLYAIDYELGSLIGVAEQTGCEPA